MKKKVLNIFIILLIGLIFIDIVGAETYNNFDPNNGPASCGNGLITEIPALIPKVVSTAYTIIQVAVPIVLVILGSFDFFKGITAAKEDDIKKRQTIFVKRLIVAVLIFFVFIIVKFVVGVISEDNDYSNNIIDCTQCFINNDC